MSKKKGVAKPPKEGLVIDSSVAIASCFPDEQDDYSQAVLDALSSERAIVPDLWHLEVANTLLVGERRKRSTQAKRLPFNSLNAGAARFRMPDMIGAKSARRSRPAVPLRN